MATKESRASELKEVADLFTEASAIGTDNDSDELKTMRKTISDNLTPERILKITNAVREVMGKDLLEGGSRRRTRSARSGRRRAKSRRRRYY
jgi:hypothetical protein